MKSLILIFILSMTTSIFAMSEDMADCGLGSQEADKSVIVMDDTEASTINSSHQ